MVKAAISKVAPRSKIIAALKISDRLQAFDIPKKELQERGFSKFSEQLFFKQLFYGFVLTLTI